MSLISLNRALLPLGTVAFFLLALVLPILRLRIRSGVWAVTFVRSRDAVERFVGVLLSLLLLALACWVFLYALWGPRALGVWELPSWTLPVGWAVAAVGLLVTIAAQAQMGASWRIGIDEQPTELVTAGLYRFVRNPIYSGIFVGGVGLLLVSPSPWLLGAALAGYLGVAWQTRREEQHMRALHGARYDEWARRVGRFFPGVGRL